MKKHENAIKAILKKGSMPHGYYEDEAGTRYIVNGHVIIKLSGSKLNFIGELPKLYKCGWTDTLNRCIDEAKKGKFEIDINMDDVKMWNKYGDKIAPYQFIVDKKYMGLSSFYLNKLYTLTDNNIITTTNFKSPVYIAGDDIECVLMPVTLVKGYDENNYNKFITELKGCYIQDAKAKEENEKQKALKNTDKIEMNVVYNGFTLYFAGRQLFILSDKKRVTNDITNEFLQIMSDITGIDYINKITEYDYVYYKSCVQAATITKTTSYSGDEKIYRIETNSNPRNFYKNEYDRLIIYNGNMEKIDICTDDMSATDTETPKNATIQDNAADIVKADNCTDADKVADTTQDTRQAETPAHKSSNCLFVTVAKDLKPEKVAQLQNVANLPTLASIPTYSAYFAHKINNIVSTKRNTNNGRKAHGRTNGATCAECAGVLKIVNTS